MSGQNTPKVKSVLNKYRLRAIPEAHCYLQMDEGYLDATSNSSDYKSIASDVIIEKRVALDFLVDAKVNYHRDFIESWLKDQTDIDFDVNELWRIREECIAALSRT